MIIINDADDDGDNNDRSADDAGWWKAKEKVLGDIDENDVVCDNDDDSDGDWRGGDNRDCYDGDDGANLNNDDDGWFLSYKKRCWWCLW